MSISLPPPSWRSEFSGNMAEVTKFRKEKFHAFVHQLPTIYPSIFSHISVNFCPSLLCIDSISSLQSTECETQSSQLPKSKSVVSRRLKPPSVQFQFQIHSFFLFKTFSYPHRVPWISKEFHANEGHK